MVRGPSRNTELAIRGLLDEAARDRRAAFSTNRQLRDALRRRVASGSVVSPHPGLFVDRELWDSLEHAPGERHAMVIRGAARRHPGWVMCHASAAHLHGLRVSHRHLDELHVADMPGSRGNSAPGVRRHYARGVEIETLDGVRMTPLVTTALDVMRTLDAREGLVIADALAGRLGMDAAGLIESLRDEGRGLTGIDRTLKVAAHANPLAESGGESMARAMIIKLRYVLPKLQVWVRNVLDPQSPFRVDGMWILPDGTVVILEVDGQEKRENERMTRGRSVERLVWDERQRESLVSAMGARVLRVSFANVVSESEMARRLDAFGVPLAASDAGRVMVSEMSAMNGGIPAPNGAVIRDGWLRFERPR